MKNARSFSIVFLGIGVVAMSAVRAVAHALQDFGDLDQAVGLGYSPENALPIAGQTGFSDSSGVQCEDTSMSTVCPKAFADSDAA